jgi:uncharacterized OB-fold protein
MSVPTRRAPERMPVPCRYCSYEVTPETRRCPRCGREGPGAVNVRETTKGLIAASVFTLVVIVVAIVVFAVLL